MPEIDFIQHSHVAARKIRPYSSISAEDIEMAYVLLQSTGATIEECTEELLRQATEVDALRQQHKGAKRKNQTRRISEPVQATDSVQVADSDKPNDNLDQKSNNKETNVNTDLNLKLSLSTHEKRWTLEENVSKNVKSMADIQQHKEQASIACRTKARPKNAPW